MDLLGVFNVGESEELLAADDRRRALDMGNKFWHTDSSFKDIPAYLSMLYGVRVVSNGGECCRKRGEGRSIFSAHASQIVGLAVPVGRILLHELTEHATSQNNVFTHNWRENDLVIWDNRCTMHRLRRYKASQDARV